ncbi:MAG: RluA family pseudouridine synthase [Gammaproteobacteria bacterium]|nr:RluA family pseudouridine synthase [Gammaproteobacteria bacterium]
MPYEKAYPRAHEPAGIGQLPQGSRSSVQHLEVSPDEAGQRLDNYVSRRLPAVPRSRIYRLIRKGEVRLNGRRTSPGRRLEASDRIRLPPVRLPASDRQDTGATSPAATLRSRTEDAIVYEDDRLLVLDKPAGMAVHGGSGVSFGVIEALRAQRPHQPLELVHRLDRDTSGCLLIASHAATLRTLHALMREGAVEKRYLTLLRGRWELGSKRIDLPLRTDTRVGGERTVRPSASGKDAVSEFHPVQFFGRTATLMEVLLRTGRTHQIRVHALHAGHPVAGDEKYGDEAFNDQLRALGLSRMFLHAHSLSFTWPQGAPFSINTPLPPDLKSLLDALSAHSDGSRGAPLRAGGNPRRAVRRRAR